MSETKIFRKKDLDLEPVNGMMDFITEKMEERS